MVRHGRPDRREGSEKAFGLNASRQKGLNHFAVTALCAIVLQLLTVALCDCFAMAGAGPAGAGRPVAGVPLNHHGHSHPHHHHHVHVHQHHASPNQQPRASPFDVLKQLELPQPRLIEATPFELIVETALPDKLTVPLTVSKLVGRVGSNQCAQSACRRIAVARVLTPLAIAAVDHVLETHQLPVTVKYLLEWAPAGSDEFVSAGEHTKPKAEMTGVAPRVWR